MSKDYARITDGTGTKVATLQKVEGSDTVELERVALDTDKLDWGGAAPEMDEVSTPGTQSAEIDCEAKSLIVLKTELSASDVMALLRIRFKDDNATANWSISEKILVSNSGDQNDIREAGFYHGELIYIRTHGAKAFKILLPKAPTNSGSISVWASAI